MRWELFLLLPLLRFLTGLRNQTTTKEDVTVKDLAVQGVINTVHVTNWQVKVAEYGSTTVQQPEVSRGLYTQNNIQQHLI